jgi:hypothetical protein
MFAAVQDASTSPGGGDVTDPLMQVVLSAGSERATHTVSVIALHAELTTSSEPQAKHGLHTVSLASPQGTAVNQPGAHVEQVAHVTSDALDPEVTTYSPLAHVLQGAHTVPLVAHASVKTPSLHPLHGAHTRSVPSPHGDTSCEPGGQAGEQSVHLKAPFSVGTANDVVEGSHAARVHVSLSCACHPRAHSRHAPLPSSHTAQPWSEQAAHWSTVPLLLVRVPDGHTSTHTPPWR